MSLFVHRSSTRLGRRWIPLAEVLEQRLTLSVGTLRVVSYNIASAGGSPRSGLDTLLKAMGDEPIAGNVQPVDILLLQEVQSQATTTSAVASLMNSLYGASSYSFGALNGASTGSGTQGIVYRTSTVQLLSEAAIGTASTTGQPRQALRYKVRPVGYTSTEDFYIYNSHFKAANDSISNNRKNIEALAIRADSDALGQGTQVIYAGDFNLYTSNEAAYQTLVSAGNGQAFDYGGTTGSWSGNNNFRAQFTQAPANNPAGGLTGGGLDDRFDFQLMTSEMNDGQGIDYVAGTYHPFGNNGSLPVNSDINSTANTALPTLSNRTTVLDLLTTVTDHLPVVAEYRVVNTLPSVQFSSSAQSGAENVGTMTITATLSATSASAVTVPYTLSGTATTTADYTISTSPLVIPAGSISGTITINVVNDTLSESDESIVVTMGTPTNAVLGATTQHVASILDNDGGVLQFSSAAYSITEGNSGTKTATITVNRTGADLSRPVSVQYRTNGGTATAGTDYVAINPASPLNFLANEASKTFTVTINGDVTNEPDETVILELLGPTGGATLGTQISSTLTIQNDDPVQAGTLQFSSPTYSIVEGNSGTSQLTISVTRTNGSTGAVSVPFSVTGGTATQGSDFSLVAGTLNWAANDSATKTFAITINGDTTFEPDETITLQLGSPTGGATLGSQATATATITNDDAATASFRVSSLTGLASGFVVQFSAGLDASAINLYNTNAGLGSPDLQLTRAGVPVTGTILINATLGKLTFLATGGAMPDGAYQVLLKSGSSAFKSQSGALLDGNGDGIAGDDYSGSFSLSRAANAREISVSDVVLGAGQSSASPIRVTLADGTGITAITFKLLYDPSILTVVNSGLTTFPDTPGFSASFNVFAPGEIRFSFASSTSNPLRAGPLTLLNVVGVGPTAAAYGSKARLQPQVSQLRQGFTAVPVVEDSGVQISAFLGDVSGDGAIDGLDALFINEYAVSNIDGFDAFQNADPNLVGDLSGEGSTDGLDALVANELAVGNTVPFSIPALPAQVPNFGGGPDPIISLPSRLNVVSGQETIVPVRLDYTDARSSMLMNADVLVKFDPDLFEVVGLRSGTIDSRLQPRLSVDSDTLRISVGGSVRGPMMHTGDSEILAYLVLRAKPTTTIRETRLNLLEQGTVAGRTVSTRLNSGRLTLGPAPTNGADDSVDSVVTLNTGAIERDRSVSLVTIATEFVPLDQSSPMLSITTTMSSTRRRLGRGRLSVPRISLAGFLR